MSTHYSRSTISQFDVKRGSRRGKRGEGGTNQDVGEEYYLEAGGGGGGP